MVVILNFREKNKINDDIIMYVSNPSLNLDNQMIIPSNKSENFEIMGYGNLAFFLRFTCWKLSGMSIFNNIEDI